MSVAGIYRGLEYESLRRGVVWFTTAKRASLLRTRRCGPSLIAAKRASLRQTRRLASRIFPSAAAKQASS